MEIFISEVAKTPLKPNAVVFTFKFELLKAHFVKLTDFRNVDFCLLDLNFCRLE
jgi:hypothetical protein